MNLRYVFNRAMSLFPRHEAIVCGEHKLNYREFAHRVISFTAVLQHHGMQPGDRVAILHRNCHYFIESYFAVCQGGGVLVPLNYRLLPSDLNSIFNDSEPRIFICDNIFREIHDNINYLKHKNIKTIWTGNLPDNHLDNYDNLVKKFKDNLASQPSIDDDNLAVLYYTSGTTGYPKGVELTHKNLYAHSLMTIGELHLTDRDVWIHAAPLFHLADAWATWAITLVGGKHVLLPVFKPETFFSLVQEEKVTITNMIPTMLNQLINSPAIQRYNFDSLRFLMSGGAPIAPELVKRVLDGFGCDFIQTYGLTETSPYLTLSILKKNISSMDPEKQLTYKCSTGRPIIGVSLKLLDGHDQEVPWDGKSVGEIVVKGDSITRGYWKNPGETKKAFINGWLRTGDLAVMDKEGYLCIVDRKKDLIITGGENVYSTEIEHVLYEHPAVFEVAVIGIPDENWGEIVKAFVVPIQNKNVTEKELKNFCKKKLAGFKVPKQIQFIKQLPKTGSGKISKKTLRDKETNL